MSQCDWPRLLHYRITDIADVIKRGHYEKGFKVATSGKHFKKEIFFKMSVGCFVE